jgi:hypothetical protein
MANKANYLRAALLNLLFRGTALAAPTTIRFHLHTADPGKGTPTNEVGTGTWTNYAFAPLAANTTNFAAPADQGAAVGHRTQNAVEVSYGTATTTGNVTVTHYTARDQAGNVLYVGALASPKTVSNGDPVRFPVGAFTATEV